MSLSTIRTQVRGWLNKPPLTNLSVGQVDFFINEAIRNVERRYPFRFLEATRTQTVATNATSITLPANWHNPQAVYLIREGKSDKLERYSRDHAFEAWPSATQTGIPQQYAIYGDRLYLYPVPGEPYRIRRDYIKHLASLSTAVSTNYLTENAKQLVVMGALAEAYAHVQEYSDASYFEKKREEQIALLIREHATQKQEDYRPRLKCGIKQYRDYFRR